MSQHNSDSGEPMPGDVISTVKQAFHAFPAPTRYVSLRNTGPNTLWVSLDGERWFDVACGTSWDERVRVDGIHHRTQTGRTFFAVVGIALPAVPSRR